MNRYWTLAVNYNISVAYSRNLESYGGFKKVSNLKFLNSGFKTQKGFSIQSSKRLKKSVSNLLILAKTKRVFDPVTNKSFKFRVNFITLTLPSKQIHSDKEIKAVIFEPYIESMVKSYNMELYCWKAERQKNGNIHFHLVTDIFINYLDLRNSWNRACNKLQYVDRFYLKNGHYNPNSTDVHSPYKVKNISAYLAKYLSKIGDLEVIEGRYYSCSHKLSQYKGFKVDSFHSKFEMFKDLCNDDNKVFFDNEYVSLWNIGIDNILNSKNYELGKLYLDYHKKLGYSIDVSGTKILGSGEVERVSKNYNRGRMNITEYTTYLTQDLPPEIIIPFPADVSQATIFSKPNIAACLGSQLVQSTFF